MEYPTQNYQQQIVNITKARLTKVGVLSFGVNAAIIGAVIGLIIGIAVAITLIIDDVAATIEAAYPWMSAITALGYLLIVICPAVFAFLGFIFGMILVLIYNLSAKITGGLNMKYEEIQ